MDMDTKLSKVLDLLIQQTESGKLRWRESYGDSFQASLANQTIVVSNVVFNPVLEIRDSRGDLVQQVGTNPATDLFADAKEQRKIFTDSRLQHKVEQLFNLLKEKKETKINLTLDNLLSELEK